MKWYYETKNNWYKIELSTWWKQFRFGIWFDNWCGAKDFCIHFGFFDLEIYAEKIDKNHRIEIKRIFNKNENVNYVLHYPSNL